MELKVLFYIVLGLVYFFFSVSKAKKKRAAEQGHRPAEPPKKNWEDELQDILRRTMQPEEPVNIPTPPERKEEKTVFLDEEMKSYQQQQKEEEKAHLKQESYSVEFDTTASPVFNEIGSVTTGEKLQSLGSKMLEEDGFDARKAFIYSEIFLRKY